MSYENTKCPCGGTKETETMICKACEVAFGDTYEFKVVYGDRDRNEWSVRRRAAISLLAMSRRRNKPVNAYRLQTAS